MKGTSVSQVTTVCEALCLELVCVRVYTRARMLELSNGEFQEKACQISTPDSEGPRYQPGAFQLRFVIEPRSASAAS